MEASVPGSVHSDLLAAGLIADPFVDDNEEHQQWIGESDWEYRTDFHHRPGPHVRTDLVFEGLDTVAHVSLNGIPLGSTANMHRVYRFDVTGVVVAGTNSLSVRLQAPTTYALAERERLGHLPTPFGTPYNFIRKMASNFGWDWGPRLTTSGIWRAVRLESWSSLRLRAVRPSVDVDDAGTGIVAVAVELEWAKGSNGAAIVATVGGVQARTVTSQGDDTAHLYLEVPHVERWWPMGRGTQTLYGLVVEATVDGRLADRWEKDVGFRTVELDTSELSDGNRWAVRVNGERVWVRGFNWITAHCFPARLQRTDCEARIGDAVSAHANLLRVWGGGTYESDEFYETCDRLGVLVWQDFLFSCAAYPGELETEVAAEAKDAVDRLMSHPSLILWNGNNECLWGWWDWGWKEAVADREWGSLFYHELLPSLVERLDPLRPYIDGSPTSGHHDIHPNDPDRGPVHIWDVWNDLDYAHYRSHRPRFVAEFGFQGAATTPTLSAAVTARPLTPDTPGLVHHQKAFDGVAKLDRALRHHLGSVRRFDRWVAATQLVQAHALRAGVGHFRSLHERCSGAIWWQLNDCWPAISWSVVDHAGRRKLAWYAAREAFTDRVLVLEPQEDDRLACVAVNDSRSSWTGTLDLRRVDVTGAVLAHQRVDLHVEADSATRIGLAPALTVPVDTSEEIVIGTVDDVRSTWIRRPLRHVDWTTSQRSVSVDGHAGGLAVVVTADTLLVDLCLFADLIDPDARLDSQLVTLLPGESHRFVISTSSRGSFDLETIEGVLVSAADLVTSASDVEHRQR